MEYMERPARNEMRDKVTALFAGVHMDDPQWASVSMAFEWEGVWPEIDADLALTGKVIEPTDWEYFPVWPSWEAVIHKDVATAAGWTIDREAGRAIPPKKGE